MKYKSAIQIILLTADCRMLLNRVFTQLRYYKPGVSYDISPSTLYESNPHLLSLEGCWSVKRAGHILVPDIRIYNF